MESRPSLAEWPPRRLAPSEDPITIRLLVSSLCLLGGLVAPAAGVTQDRAPTGRAADGMAVYGWITDRMTDDPVPAARVVFRRVGQSVGTAWEGTSGAGGGFVTPLLPLGEYVVRVEVLGFSPVTDIVALEDGRELDLRIGMVPEAIALEPVLVAVRRRSRLESQGFYDRRRVGNGHFITRAEIEARGATRLADLFYRVPGARVVGAGTLAAPSVQLRGSCTPLVVLDGVPLSGSVRLDEFLQVSSVEAIEVYNGPTAPIQYSRFGSCGTIVVWTREPDMRNTRGFSWRRTLIGGAIFGAIVFLGG